MPPDPPCRNTDLPNRRDSLAVLFGLPTGQQREPQDTPPGTPPRSSRLGAILSWLWQFFLHGFAACGVAMYPCFADPGELSDLLGLPRRAPAEPEIRSPAEPSCPQFDAPQRQSPRIAGYQWHAPVVSGYREQGAAEPEVSQP